MIHGPAIAPDKDVPTVEVTDPVTGDYIGRVLNLSRAGLLVISVKPFTEGTRHRLRLTHPEGDEATAVVLTAETVYCESSTFSNSHGTGFAIVEIHQGELARLFPSVSNARFGLSA